MAKIIIYRMANWRDVTAISRFCDYWLTGGGIKDGAPGAVHDCFIREGQHRAYLVKYKVWLATEREKVVGWAVVTREKVLLHLLVAGDCRSRGIGSVLLELSDAFIIRSKTDQSTGDPGGFYTKRGFELVSGPKVGRRSNIALYRKTDATVPEL